MVEGEAMPELRRHYFLDEYCIIAAERKKRPSDFRRERSVAADEKTYAHFVRAMRR